MDLARRQYCVSAGVEGTTLEPSRLFPTHWAVRLAEDKHVVVLDGRVDQFLCRSHGCWVGCGGRECGAHFGRCEKGRTRRGRRLLCSARDVRREYVYTSRGSEHGMSKVPSYYHSGARRHLPLAPFAASQLLPPIMTNGCQQPGDLASYPHADWLPMPPFRLPMLLFLLAALLKEGQSHSP